MVRSEKENCCIKELHMLNVHTTGNVYCKIISKWLNVPQVFNTQWKIIKCCEIKSDRTNQHSQVHASNKKDKQNNPRKLLNVNTISLTDKKLQNNRTWWKCYALFLQRTQSVNQHPIPSCNIHNGRSWYLILVIFPLQLIFSKLQLFKQLFEPLMLSKLIFQLEVLGLQELFFLYLSLQVQL